MPDNEQKFILKKLKEDEYQRFKETVARLQKMGHEELADKLIEQFALGQFWWQR